MDPTDRPVVGVLAIQGDFEAHARMLRAVGGEPRRVRARADLDRIDALVIPGGESTTMTLGLEREAMTEPLRSLLVAGTPVLGTCAGLIMLDRVHLGVLDVLARRNAFGRQVRSFEADLQLASLGDEPLQAVFIRAPWVDEAGPDVETLAEIDGHGVAVRQGDIVAVAFHPEIADDDRLHRWLVERALARRVAAGPAGGDRSNAASARQRTIAPRDDRLGVAAMRDSGAA